MNLNVSVVIYFYIFICIALLVFNIIYIFRDAGKERFKQARIQRWYNCIMAEYERVVNGQPVTAKHKKRIVRQLLNSDRLLIYNEAMLCVQRATNGDSQCYLDECSAEFLALAVDYQKKPAMERAFFAYVISMYHPGQETSGGQLSNILLRYFDDSTIFCRENVLQALYALGRPQVVLSAFSMLNDNGWYHHSRLLSDGLSAFSGDQEALAWKLWEKCTGWKEFL